MAQYYLPVTISIDVSKGIDARLRAAGLRTNGPLVYVEHSEGKPIQLSPTNQPTNQDDATARTHLRRSMRDLGFGVPRGLSVKEFNQVEMEGKTKVDDGDDTVWKWERPFVAASGDGNASSVPSAARATNADGTSPGGDGHSDPSAQAQVYSAVAANRPRRAGASRPAKDFFFQAGTARHQDNPTAYSALAQDRPTLAVQVKPRSMLEVLAGLASCVDGGTDATVEHRKGIGTLHISAARTIDSLFQTSLLTRPLREEYDSSSMSDSDSESANGRHSFSGSGGGWCGDDDASDGGGDSDGDGWGGGPQLGPGCSTDEVHHSEVVVPNPGECVCRALTRVSRGRGRWPSEHNQAVAAHITYPRSHIDHHSRSHLRSLDRTTLSRQSGSKATTVGPRSNSRVQNGTCTASPVASA